MYPQFRLRRGLTAWRYHCAKVSIRGNIVATLAFVDIRAHRQALPWYRTGPREPIGRNRAVQVSAAIPLTVMSLDGLLDAVIQNAHQGDSIIIVGHGREGGLSMPIFPHSPSRARAELVALLASDRTASGFIPMPARPSADIAPVCGLTVAQIDQLRAKMVRIRALRLQHVALRACNTGGWPDVLRMYKPFFDATEVSAPDRRDTYGELRIGAPVADLDRWVVEHRDGHMYVEGVAPDRVALQTVGGASEEHSYSVAIAAESGAGLEAWAARNQISGTGAVRLYHGQFSTYGAPGVPRIAFSGTQDYASHIVVV